MEVLSHVFPCAMVIDFPHGNVQSVRPWIFPGHCTENLSRDKASVDSKFLLCWQQNTFTQFEIGKSGLRIWFSMNRVSTAFLPIKSRVLPLFAFSAACIKAVSLYLRLETLELTVHHI